MIRRLEGRLLEYDEDTLVVDVNGVGFEVRIPLSTRSGLPQHGENVVLYTHMTVRQDAITLYGFSSASELRLFGHLTSITGVGPKVALSIISGHTPDRFYQAVLHEDVSALTTVPGVGNKTAQRIILELSDKIGVKKRREKLPKASATSGYEEPDTVELASEALMALGYGRMEAAAALEKVLPEAEAPIEVEDLITRALRALARI